MCATFSFVMNNVHIISNKVCLDLHVHTCIFAHAMFGSYVWNHSLTVVNEWVQWSFWIFYICLLEKSPKKKAEARIQSGQHCACTLITHVEHRMICLAGLQCAMCISLHDCECVYSDYWTFKYMPVLLTSFLYLHCIGFTADGSVPDGGDSVQDQQVQSPILKPIIRVTPEPTQVGGDSAPNFCVFPMANVTYFLWCRWNQF